MSFPIRKVNRKCRCGSGRVIRHCCLPLFLSARQLDAEHGRYPTYFELWPGGRTGLSRIRSYAKRFGTRHLLLNLATANNYIMSAPRARRKEAEQFLLRASTGPSTFLKCRFWLSINEENEVLPRKNLLHAMALAASMLHPDEHNPPIQNQSHAIGAIMLHVNSILSQRQGAYFGFGSSTDQDRLLGLEFAQQYIYRGENRHFGASRLYWMITKGVELLREAQNGAVLDLDRLHEEARGYSITETLLVGLVMHGTLSFDWTGAPPQLDWRLVNPGYTSGIHELELRNKAALLLRDLSQSVAQVRTKWAANSVDPLSSQALSEFYDFPLVEGEPNLFWTWDTRLYCSRLLTGWEFGLLDAQPKPVDAATLRGFKGRLLSRYVTEVAKHAAHRNPKVSVLADGMSGFPRFGDGRIPDLIVKDGNYLVVVEVTAQSVPPKVALCESFARIQQSLMRVFGVDRQGFGERKLQQIEDWVERARNASQPHEIIGDVASLRVLPVLLLADALPQDSRLWRKYRALIASAGYKPWISQDLTIMSVQEWEGVGVRSSQGFSLGELLAQKLEGKLRNHSVFEFLSSQGHAWRMHPIASRSLEDLWRAGVGRVVPPEQDSIR